MKKVDSPEFQIKLQKNKSRTKKNSIYALIAEDPAAIANVIANNAIQKMQTCDAYLVEFSTTDYDLINLFKAIGYNFNKRHLRIDATYVSSQFGYCPFHYTEIYLNASTNNSITVHAYFNSYGKYLYSEAKKTDLNSNLTEPQKIPPKCEKDFQNNYLAQVFNCLDSLLVHKNNVYKLELDNSYRLEKELSKSSKKINTETGITNYISIANQFICSINRINALNETYIDTRARKIRTLVMQFLNKKFHLSSTRNNSQEEEEKEEVVAIATGKEEIINISPTAQLTIKPQQEYANLPHQAKDCIEKIKRLIGSRESIDYHSLDKTIFSGQLIALNIYDVPTKQRKKTQPPNIIENLEKTINQAQGFIKTNLIQAITQGDLHTLSTAFEHSKHNLTIDHCLELLNKIKLITDITAINPFLEICDFLHNNSDVFKTSIIIFSMSYTAEDNAEDNIVSSAMFVLYRRNNLALFKKLIEYSANCRIGMYDINNKRRIPLLNAILFFEAGKPTPDFSYINELLTNTCYPLTSGETLSKSSYVANNKAAKNAELNIVFNAIYKSTPLEIALDRYKNNINAALVEKLTVLSNLESLSLSLAWFTSTTAVEITPPIASDTKNGVYLCNTQEQINIRTEHESSNIYDRLFFLISIQETPEVINIFKKPLHNVYTAFRDKISQQNDLNASINSIINNLTTDASHKMPATQTYKFIQYSACLFLLAQKPILDLPDTQRSLILLKNTAATYLNYALKPELECKLFNNAYNFLHKNKFQSQLADTNPATCGFITTRNNTLRNTHQPKLLNIALAVKQNNFQMLQKFIANCYYSYLDLNACVPGNDNKRTLLHYACDNQSDFLECAQILILLGASIDSKDTNKNSPLDLIPKPKMRESLKELSNIYNTLINKNIISAQTVTCMLQQNIFMLPTITAMLYNKYQEFIAQNNMQVKFLKQP